MLLVRAEGRLDNRPRYIETEVGGSKTEVAESKTEVAHKPEVAGSKTEVAGRKYAMFCAEHSYQARAVTTPMAIGRITRRTLMPQFYVT